MGGSGIRLFFEVKIKIIFTRWEVLVVLTFNFLPNPNQPEGKKKSQREL